MKTLYLSFKKSNDSLEVFEFNNLMTFNRGISVKLKPENSYNHKNSFVYNIKGKKPQFIGGEWDINGIKFYSRNLTSYTIISDLDPPIIEPIQVDEDNIRIRIIDNLSGIKEYEAKINDKWVLFEYDNKNEVIISKKLDLNQSFKGKFVLVVSDRSDNKSIYKINI